MASEENIEKTLGYLQERSRNIRRLSEKLEKELWKLENIFNTEYYCRICFQEKELYTNNVIDNSEKAKQWINKRVPHDEFLFNPEVQDILIIKPHKFVPAIDIVLDIMDQGPFYSEVDDDNNIVEEYYLCFRDGKIAAIKKINGEESHSFWLPKATRELSIEGIKSMLLRLPEFFEYVASKLSEEERKRADLLELAEKVNAAILQ